MKVKRILLLSVLCFTASVLFAHHKDVVVIENEKIPTDQKEAILILPGFGSKIHGVNDIKTYFSYKGYDLFIPHYLGRDSLQQCVATVNTFIEKHRLLNYKKLHVFSYIAGSWVLNLWLSQHPVNNITSVVYDRSPLQERAPYVLVKDNPLLIKMIAGKIMKNFSQTPYPSTANDAKHIGIIIENKATKLIIKHKHSAISLGPVSFNKDSLYQPCDDYLYECINHDEMYYQFNKIGQEILYFFKKGTFSNSASHQPYVFDVWDKRINACGQKTD